MYNLYQSYHQFHVFVTVPKFNIFSPMLFFNYETIFFFAPTPFFFLLTLFLHWLQFSLYFSQFHFQYAFIRLLKPVLAYWTFSYVWYSPEAIDIRFLRTYSTDFFFKTKLLNICFAVGFFLFLWKGKAFIYFDKW